MMKNLILLNVSLLISTSTFAIENYNTQTSFNKLPEPLKRTSIEISYAQSFHNINLSTQNKLSATSHKVKFSDHKTLRNNSVIESSLDLDIISSFKKNDHVERFSSLMLGPSLLLGRKFNYNARFSFIPFMSFQLAAGKMKVLENIAEAKKLDRNNLFLNYGFSVGLKMPIHEKFCLYTRYDISEYNLERNEKNQVIASSGEKLGSSSDYSKKMQSKSVTVGLGLSF